MSLGGDAIQEIYCSEIDRSYNQKEKLVDDGSGWWVNRYGKYTLISQMSDKYLASAINSCVRLRLNSSDRFEKLLVEYEKRNPAFCRKVFTQTNK